MHRRIAPLFLVALLLIPVLPVEAASPETGAPAETDSPVESAEPSVSPTEEPASGSETSPGAEPGTDPAPVIETGVEPDGEFGLAALPDGAPDPTGRYIVVLREGRDVAKVSAKHRKHDGVKTDAQFRKVGAFSAKLSARQRIVLEADPAVAAVVPDEVIEVAAQSMPTGVARIGGRTSAAAKIDGIDERVDADVAIVDTGIDATHPDLNVLGGINCSTSDPTAWRDVHGHGTHVAGTVGAKDDDYGVVGVAPGVRLWAVKILNDDGYGLLSWYVCGLDWIAAQKDPADSSRQMIEAVNMSVAKTGKDDRNCGWSSNDILHQAICRLVATGVTVVAAAANASTDASKYVPAAYDEVITVSALADLDGKPGGLGPQKCGSYNEDDAFATFSNYGADVDLIAPGKCIMSTLPGARFGWSSGTSMAAPHVAGAVALYKATRPWATTAEVIEALKHLGNYNWKTSTDPDGNPDILLDVAAIGPYGDFSMGVGAATASVTAPGATMVLPVTINRSSTFLERVSLTASGPAGVALSLDRGSVYGFSGTSAYLTITIPSSTPGGIYTVTVTGSEHGRTRQASTSFAVMGRLAGSDRFATAAAVSAATFAPGVDVAYVATAFNFPDALAGAAAAGNLGGPVLLAAATGTLHSATANELARLKPKRIVVLGSAGVISDGVVSQLGQYVAP